MPDALTRLLSRFTPEDGVDRDELMYAAGRASVPSPARWKAMAALLALGQILTLLFVVGRADPPRSSPTPPSRESSPAPSFAAEPRRRVIELAEPTAGETDLVPDDPPLRVFASGKAFSID